MKIFSFILAILVLVLSCMPCKDGTLAMGSKNETKKEVVDRLDDHSEEEHEDACSPFCHCTCCASFSINHWQPFEAALPDFGSRSPLTFISENIIEVSLPVWQPPQLI